MALPPDHRCAAPNDHFGQEFGPASPTWLDQPRIDRFAEGTGDDRWIHVDVARDRTQTNQVR